MQPDFNAIADGITRNHPSREAAVPVVAAALQTAYLAGVASQVAARREELMTKILLVSARFDVEGGDALSVGDRAKIVQAARLWADLIIETAKTKAPDAGTQTEGGADVIG